MVPRKSKTKRVTLRLKYNIEKRAKSHRKKMKKAAKDTPWLNRRKLSKDPGIPNLFPYKEALLQRAERLKEKMEEEQIKQKEARRKEIEKRRKAARAGTEPQFSLKPAERELRHNRKELVRKQMYMKDLKKVLEAADVILEVLDARDPLGCRCYGIEKLILGKLSAQSVRPKRIILILNKIDLVPPEVVEKWVTYLKREFPTIAFKASTQQGGAIGTSSTENVSEITAAANRSVSSGGLALQQILKQYCMSLGLKTAISVGLIGYPNVGKSSIINSLKRSKAVGVSANPGFTKQVQEVRLDKNIVLLDSPGVIFASEESDPHVVLRNVIKVEDIEDPVTAVTTVFNKVSAKALMECYKLPHFNTVEEFLFLIGQQRGKLLKGGIPDVPAAARAVLRDWNQGKISYYSAPPEITDEAERVNGKTTAQIVDSWAPEFDIDSIIAASNKETMASLKADRAAKGDTAMQIEMNMPVTRSERDAEGLDTIMEDADDEDMDGDDGEGEEDEGDMMDDGDDEEEGDESEKELEPFAKPQGADEDEDGDADMDMDDEEEEAGVEQKVPAKPVKKLSAADPFNPQTNQEKKKAQKKEKKMQEKFWRRAHRNGTAEAGDMDVSQSNNAASAAYDFDADWQE